MIVGVNPKIPLHFCADLTLKPFFIVMNPYLLPGPQSPVSPNPLRMFKMLLTLDFAEEWDDALSVQRIPITQLYPLPDCPLSTPIIYLGLLASNN